MERNIADAVRGEIEFIKGQLEARKGNWPQIAKDMRPDGWQSYYSWLTKFAQGRIEYPDLDTLQSLSDYLRSHSGERQEGARQ